MAFDCNEEIPRSLGQKKKSVGSSNSREKEEIQKKSVHKCRVAPIVSSNFRSATMKSAFSIPIQGRIMKMPYTRSITKNDQQTKAVLIELNDNPRINTEKDE